MKPPSPPTVAATLTKLRAYLKATNEDDMGEARAHIIFYAAPIADAFNVTADRLIEECGKCSDRELRNATLASCEARLAAIRKASADKKAAAQQSALDALAAGGFEFDAARFATLLATCMPPIAGYLEFDLNPRDCGAKCAISARKLLQVKQLKRADLTATVDKNGMHIRGGGGSKLRLTLRNLFGSSDWKKQPASASLYLSAPITKESAA